MKQLQRIFGAMFLIMGFIVFATWSSTKPTAQTIDSSDFRLPSKEAIVRQLLEDPKIADLKNRNAKLDKVADTIVKDGDIILSNAKGVEMDMAKNLETAKRINRRISSLGRANAARNAPETLHWIDSTEIHKSGWFERWFRLKKKASN